MMRKGWLEGLIGATAALTLLASAPTAFAQASVKVGLILPMTGPFGIDRPADRGSREALYRSARRQSRRQDHRARSQGRPGHRRHHQAPRPGTHRQRQGCDHRRLRPDAARARRRPGGDPGQGPCRHHGGRHGDDRRKIAVLRAHQFHVAAEYGADGRLERQNGIKTVVTLVSDYGPGLDAEAAFKKEFEAAWRQSARHSAGAARQSGFRSLPAEGQGFEARCAVPLRAVGPGRDLDETGQRTRPDAGRHQSHRHRRRDRRRSVEQHG